MFDYTIVTELPGDQITAEAMRMLRTRYAVARNLAAGRDVLELACGPALGVSYLAGNARSVVAGDCNFEQLRSAFPRTGRRLPLVCLDAHCLPFREKSFDLVILFEALYYLDNHDRFLQECLRVMRPDGILLLCLANPAWPGFNPSPLSTKYFSAADLSELLTTSGFVPEVYGAFPSRPTTMAQRARDHIRRIAVRGGLIPKTLRQKAKLKRLFYGQLKTVGKELVDNEKDIESLVRISGLQNASRYRILYAMGRPVSGQTGSSRPYDNIVDRVPKIEARGVDNHRS